MERSKSKLGVIACSALLISSLIASAPIMGCTQQQKVTVAQEIVNWTPALTSAVDTTGGMVEILDPAVAPIVAGAVTAFNVLAPQFTAAAQNYLANPSQTNIQVLQGLITQMQNSVNGSLATLNAVHVTNPASQQKAITAVNGIGTIVNSLLALIQSVSTKQQVAVMSQHVTVHLAQVAPVLDRNAMQHQADMVTADLNMPRISTDQYLEKEAHLGF